MHTYTRKCFSGLRFRASQIGAPWDLSCYTQGSPLTSSLHGNQRGNQHDFGEYLLDVLRGAYFETNKHTNAEMKRMCGTAAKTAVAEDDSIFIRLNPVPGTLSFSHSYPVGRSLLVCFEDRLLLHPTIFSVGFPVGALNLGAPHLPSSNTSESADTMLVANQASVRRSGHASCMAPN